MFIFINDLLQEVVFGIFSGLSFENNMVAFRRIIENWDIGDCTLYFENGDSYDDVLKRVIQFKQQEIDSCQEFESILLVGHSTFFRYLIKALLKFQNSETTRDLHLKRGHLSLIVRGPSGYELEMHNYLHDG